MKYNFNKTDNYTLDSKTSNLLLSKLAIINIVAEHTNKSVPYIAFLFNKYEVFNYLNTAIKVYNHHGYDYINLSGGSLR